jgi:hypothetical protein
MDVFFSDPCKNIQGDNLPGLMQIYLCGIQCCWWIGCRSMKYWRVFGVLHDLLKMDPAATCEGFTTFIFSGGDEIEIMRLPNTGKGSLAESSGLASGLEINNIAAGPARNRDAGLRVASPAQYGNDGSVRMGSLVCGRSQWEMKQSH